MAVFRQGYICARSGLQRLRRGEQNEAPRFDGRSEAGRERGRRAVAHRRGGQCRRGHARLYRQRHRHDRGGGQKVHRAGGVLRRGGIFEKVQGGRWRERHHRALRPRLLLGVHGLEEGRHRHDELSGGRAGRALDQRGRHGVRPRGFRPRDARHDHHAVSQRRGQGVRQPVDAAADAGKALPVHARADLRIGSRKRPRKARKRRKRPSRSRSTTPIPCG